jgi:hypothetical protein
MALMGVLAVTVDWAGIGASLAPLKISMRSGLLRLPGTLVLIDSCTMHEDEGRKDVIDVL